MKKILKYLFVIVLLKTNITIAETVYVEKIDKLRTVSSIDDFQVDPLNPKNIGVVTIGTTSIYISNDGGETWTDITTAPRGMGLIRDFIKKINGKVVEKRRIEGVRGLIKKFAICSNSIYCGDHEGQLFFSYDLGNTWKKIYNFPSEITYIKINPYDDKIIFIGTRLNGIFITKDKGKKWVNVFKKIPDININDICFTKKYISKIYLATDKGVYKSTDDGIHFSEINTGFGEIIDFRERDILSIPKNVLRIFFVKETLYAVCKEDLYLTNLGLYKSNNEGKYWLKIYGDLEKMWITDMEPIGEEGEFFIFAFGGKYLTKYDKIIDYLSIEGMQNYDIIGKIYYSSVDKIFYLLTENAHELYKSKKLEDKTEPKWHRLNLGIPYEYKNAKFTDIIIEDNNNIYTTINTGSVSIIYKSYNGGINWESIREARESGSNKTVSVIIDEKDHTKIWKIVSGKDENKIFYSKDEGYIWIQCGSINESLKKIRNIVTGKEPNVIYSYGFGGILKNEDNGNSWSVINYNLPNLDVSTLVIDNIQPANIYVGTGDGIFKCTESRKYEWIYKNTGIESKNILSIAIDWKNPNKLFTGAGKGLYKSLDGGENWSKINNELLLDLYIRKVIIDKINSNYIIVATNKGVYRSKDEGETWNSLNKGLIEKDMDIIDIEMSTADKKRIIFLLTVSNEIYRYEEETK